MEFEWDEGKRRLNVLKHGVDFLEAALIFEGPTLTKRDGRRSYGEVRHVSLGEVDVRCFVVVHTQRGRVTRLISAWRGGRDERARYEESLAGGAPEAEG